jgi:hypothetical protein
MNKKSVLIISLFVVVVILIASDIWYYEVLQSKNSPSTVIQTSSTTQQTPQNSTTTQTYEIRQAMSLISLPTAFVNVNYNIALQIASHNISKGQWEVASISGQLPPGLSVIHLEHGCIPTQPECPQNNFDLNGKATRTGTYTFNVAFSIGGDQITQPYQVQVLAPNSPVREGAR